MKPSAWVASCAGAIRLAGCSAEIAVRGPDDGRSGVAPAATAPAAGSVGAAPARVHTVPPVPPPRPGGLAVARPASPPVLPDRPLAELVGMGEADLTIAIGQPHEVLRQPPATIWRYRLRGCIVDLFLFRDLESDRLKSLSFAVAGSDAVSAGPQDPRCADAGRTKSDG